MKKFNDRRVDKRIPAILDIACSPNSTESIEFFASSRNISEKGAKLITPRALVPGSKVFLSFSLPSLKSKVGITGLVIWTTPSPEKYGWYNTGLRFEMLDRDQKKALQDFISYRSERPSKISPEYKLHIVSERRQSKRIFAKTSLSLIPDLKGSRTLAVQSKDLSDSGLCLLSPEPLKCAQNIIVSVEDSTSGKNMSFGGSVIRVSMSADKKGWFEIGIKFHTLNKKQKTLLQDLSENS
ncbi:MAG: PilZ domain-containing protein [Candidatus Omnitrophica bacterium]|nr:PilZ domain-containing protein [Candidatus Omnitrophota bacterium]